MKNLSSLFTAVLTLIYTIPGISYFAGDIYPTNVSKAFVTTIIEVIGAVIILILFRKKETVRNLSEKCQLRVISYLIIALFVFVAIFACIHHWLILYDGDRNTVLTPIGGFFGRLNNIDEIAHTNHQNLAQHLGVDRLSKLMEQDYPTAIFLGQSVYIFVITTVFSIIIFLFTFLGLIQPPDEKETGKADDQNNAVSNLHKT